MKNIAILFESHEWSSFKLADELTTPGTRATLVDMEEDIALPYLLSFDLVVNRVFASAQFRNHNESLRKMPKVLKLLEENDIPVVNSPAAHAYETDKALTTRTLGEHGLSVPEVYGVFASNDIPPLKYPCVIKPNCGGRSSNTYIVKSDAELADIQLPDVQFIAQSYEHPEYGFLTRIEVIGGECALIVKRSVTESGLSSFAHGSTYAPYPGCSEDIKNAAITATRLLGIATGSLDIIENSQGFYIIDVNSVSNAAQCDTITFGFDLMKETAGYILKMLEVTT